MQFTWFASAYDTDDVHFRLMTLLQMIGVLILASGVPAMGEGRLTTVVIGYVVMRLAMMMLWLRAAKEHPERRTTCLRSAVGILMLQALWIASLWVPPSQRLTVNLVLIVLELLVPVWALRAGRTPWHAHHIAERFGLFTIIVLGECVLGASNAVASVLQTQGWSLNLALVGWGSVALIFSLWWVYFLVPSGEALHHHRDRAFVWSYGHAPVFASLAALGAFIGVIADQLKPDAGAGGHVVDPVLAIALVAAAAAVYLAVIMAINGFVTQHEAQMGWLLIPAFALMGGVVAAVAMGLSLPWAMALMPLGPMLLIGLGTRMVKHSPEKFAIR